MDGATYLDFDKARTTGMRLIRTGENPTFGLLIVTGISVGLRIGDLLELTYGNLRGERLEITESKTGKKRSISLSYAVKEAMRFFPKEKFPDSFHAFRSQKNMVYSNQHVNRLLRRYFAGDRISSHSLRKTFGRRVWDMNNQSEAALIKLGGIFNHNDVSTTRRYLGITQEEIDDVYMNL